jgi:hypothetical protein
LHGARERDTFYHEKATGMIERCPTNAREAAGGDRTGPAGGSSTSAIITRSLAIPSKTTHDLSKKRKESGFILFYIVYVALILLFYTHDFLRHPCERTGCVLDGHSGTAV